MDNAFVPNAAAFNRVVELLLDIDQLGTSAVADLPHELSDHGVGESASHEVLAFILLGGAR